MMETGEREAGGFILGVHHVGIVVASIEEAVASYCGAFGFRREGGVVHDPGRQVRIQFLLDVSERVRLELLEPIGEASPVASALQEGGGINHICSETGNLEEAIAGFRRQGAVLITVPAPAPAISSADVAFLYDRVQGVFELVAAPAVVTPVAEAP